MHGRYLQEYTYLSTDSRDNALSRDESFVSFRVFRDSQRFPELRKVNGTFFIFFPPFVLIERVESRRRASSTSEREVLSRDYSLINARMHREAR